MRIVLVQLLPFFLLACEPEAAKPEDTAAVVAGDDEDGDGYKPSEGDCDDNDVAANPGATEACDGIDNNCDGTVDEGLTVTWYADVDGDGFGDAAAPVVACEPPSIAYSADGTDCDDHDSTINPAAEELCNEFDDDCDQLIDEDVTTTWYADADGDGFGDVAAGGGFCSDPGAGWVADSTDCDDSEATTFSGATEVCDELDNDCDGAVDEDVTTKFWADTDGDAYGDDASPRDACSLPTGYAAAGGDCDDADATVNPGAAEFCNGDDDDCDLLVDDADPDLDPSSGGTWYSDADGDGYGDSSAGVFGCTQPIGSTTDATDCDDTDVTVNPGATELCNGIDDDCDALVDIDDPTVDLASGGSWYTDSDGDGYGDPSALVTTCEEPADAVSDATDCDDTDAAVNPAATELCNGIDDDCDGGVDEADAADASTWYSDSDGDGFGDALSTTTACDAPAGYLADYSDCDDTDATIYPGAPAHCGLDADCDGMIEDVDPGAIRAGSLVAGDSQRFQYSDVAAGAGWLDANWDGSPDADSYELAVGTSAGADDVYAWTDRGAVTDDTLSGLTIDGAWTGAEYHVSVRAVTGGDACPTVQTAEVVQIAEGVLWTGNAADLRATDPWGGYTLDWPEAGTDAVYGEHWFEEVNLPSGTVVRVQGWGAVDAVLEGVSATDAAVASPADGWLALYANDVTISGTIVATGAGFGGGGGGGGSGTTSYQGHGGALGLGGDGGISFTSYAGAGGGGSPGGLGGVGATTGGEGNLYGGGGGSTGCGGSNGRDGGDGTASTYGGTGGTASSMVPGTPGIGEFSAGGGTGVSGCDNWSGGGGGGYGAGGGGGAQWAGSSQDSSGGGGGGTGGVGGADSGDGGFGAGPWGGVGGSTSGRVGIAGTVGGYLGAASNSDTSTDRSLTLGSGGGGGGGGYQETGGGGGAAGGGAIHLYAFDSLWIDSAGRLLANGAGGGGGAQDEGGGSTSATGGGGGGGGLRVEARNLTIDAACPALSVRAGNGDTSAGGTIKLFYDTLTGTTPSSSCAGRVYDGGPGSYGAP